MLATLKILNAYFWKTIYGPILTFIFPIVILGVIGNIFRIEYVFPGIVASSIMFIGVLALPLAIMELKNSSIFKYIGSSPVNPIRFTLVVIGFYVGVSLMTTIVVMLGTMAMFSSSVFPKDGQRHGVFSGIFGTVAGGGSFVFALFLHLIFAVVIGLVIATFSSTPQQALTIGLVITIPSLFLSGMIISVDVIGQSKVMSWISRFTPFRYTVGNLVVASTPLDQLGSAKDILSRLPFLIAAPGGATYYGNQWDDFIKKDPVLQKLVDTPAAHVPSDNNIFDWVDKWGVRKMPSVSQLKDFAVKYLMGPNDDGGDANRFAQIYNQMKEGHIEWLDVFFKQSNVLYFQADRVLNVLAPIAVSGIGLYATYSQFTWAVR